MKYKVKWYNKTSPSKKGEGEPLSSKSAAEAVVKECIRTTLKFIIMLKKWIDRSC